MQVQYNFSEISHVGNVRAKNEDSCKAIKTINGDLFVVCDGMGGAAEGKKASSLAVDSIVAYFTKEKHENIQIALYKSLEFANEQIFATAQAFPDFKGMGTTACIILLQEDEFYFAHVGDSRIYLFSDANLFQLTKDHSFVNQLVEQGTISIDEAKTHKDKNRILKALGVHPKVEPTISTQPMLLKKNDVLLSCSDGLTDMVSDNEIKEILNTQETIESKTKILVEKALVKGGRDNITLQTIEVTESPHNTSVFIDKTLYPKKDLSKTLESEVSINTEKPTLPFNKLLIALSTLFILIGISFYFLRKNNTKTTIKKTTVEAKNPKENKEQLLIADSVKVRKPKKVKTPLNKAIPYFIIGEKNNPENNIYKTLTQYKKHHKVSLTNKEIEKLNDKKLTDFKKGDTLFLLKKDQKND